MASKTITRVWILTKEDIMDAVGRMGGRVEHIWAKTFSTKDSAIEFADKDSGRILKWSRGSKRYFADTGGAYAYNLEQVKVL